MLFSKKYKISIIGTSKILDGRVPVNWFEEKSANSRAENGSKESRIVPVNSFLSTRKNSGIFSSTQTKKSEWKISRQGT